MILTGAQGKELNRLLRMHNACVGVEVQDGMNGGQMLVCTDCRTIIISGDQGTITVVEPTTQGGVA